MVARISSSTTASISGDGFKTLAEGAKVEYESRQGDKGPEATNVVLASS